MSEFLYPALAVYAILFVIKLAFALEALPHVVSIYSIREKGVSWSWGSFFLIGAFIVVSSVFYVIPALLKERMGFFVAYRRFTVTKEVLMALRAIHR